MSVEIYSFFNNKGGVGKTTLCFHASTLFAATHPDTQVLVIDMCPQSNISQLLLGGARRGYENNQRLQKLSSRKNIVGFIEWLMRGNSDFNKPQTTYRVQVCKYNENIPKNLFLIAGDPFLEVMSLGLNYSVLNPTDTQAWKDYMTAIQRLCRWEFDDSNYKKLVVFIDCNPSFSIYTQMALTSSNHLIVPMTADYSSLEGIRGFFMLLFGENPSQTQSKYAEKFLTYNRQVKNFDLKVPKIWEFVFNNYTKSSGSQGIATAYKVIKDELMNFCYQKYKDFGFDYFAYNNNDTISLSEWTRLYVSDVKDFHSAGKVCLAWGIPLHKIDPGKYKMPEVNNVVTINKNQYEQSLKDLQKFVHKIV